MDFDDIFDNPAFYILGGLGSIAVLAGWIISRKMGMIALPFWQVAVTLVVIWIASAYFSQD